MSFIMVSLVIISKWSANAFLSSYISLASAIKSSIASIISASAGASSTGLSFVNLE